MKNTMKSKKYIWLAICSTVLLVGCDIPAEKIHAAISVCKANGGLDFIGVNHAVACKNGAAFKHILSADKGN